VTLPELQFEIPPITQRGVFTTLEGLLDRAVENLEGTQPLRRATDPEGADAVGAFIDKLRAARNADPAALPFTIVLDDPSGNSFLENLHAPRPDPALRVRHYARSLEQNHAMGMYAESAGVGVTVDSQGNPVSDGVAGGGAPAADEDVDTGTLAGSSAHTIFPQQPVDMSGNEPSRFRKGGALIRGDTTRATLTERRRRAGVVRAPDGRMEALVFDSSNSDAAKEVMRFPQACFSCSAPGECRMCVTDVPHFKEVILMAFACDECGWKDVEVKGGGAMPPQGTVTTLVYDPTLPDAAGDMTRDVIKSDTSAVEIPEVDLHMEAGSLGGMYTTVEGLLAALLDKLLEGNPFMAAATDSADAARSAAFADFVDRLTAVRDGRVPFTLRLRDPLANSWIYSPTAPAPDPRLTHETYVRSHEEDLGLGLLDMRTEGYGEDALPADAEEEAAAGDEGGKPGAPAPAPATTDAASAPATHG
jgi:zinc finger protein